MHMIFHRADTVSEGFQKILLRTVDTDVTLAVTAAMTNIQELWVSFGTAQHFRHIPAHEIAASLLSREVQGSDFIF